MARVSHEAAIAAAPDSIFRMSTQTRDQVLVSSEWLTERIDDPAVRVVEVDVSPAAFNEGHIPGATLWDIYQDLKDGDYQFVGKAAFEELVRKSGIEQDSVVVLYGYGPALGFWLMRLYGHGDVRVLDVNRDTWQAEGRPWSAAKTERPRSEYVLADEDASIRASIGLAEEAIGDPARTLLDVRSQLQVSG